MIEYIYTHANMYTIVYLQKDRSLGLDAEFLHVFISKKKIKFNHYIIRRFNK